jgi:hypothetical protein
MRLSWPYVDDIFTRPMQGDIARLRTLLYLVLLVPRQGLHAACMQQQALLPLLLIPSLLLPALIVNLQILLAY